MMSFSSCLGNSSKRRRCSIGAWKDLLGIGGGGGGGGGHSLAVVAWPLLVCHRLFTIPHKFRNGHFQCIGQLSGVPSFDLFKQIDMIRRERS